MPTGLLIWTYASWLILAVCLFPFILKFVFVNRVRRAERKLKRETTEQERKEIRRRAIPVVAFITVTFAYIFTKILVIKYFPVK